MEQGQPKSTRKRRNRKRKRRIVSDSSSSEDSSSSSSDASTPDKTVTIPIQQPKPSDGADTDQDESSSSEESPDDTDSDEQDVDMSAPSTSRRPQAELLSQRGSPSPPPNVDIPPFILPDAPESEQALKEKFRKFWMASIAEGFKDDLEEIRKEPNLGPSRLALLIESLASGASVFSSSSPSGGVNEMEVVLDQLS